MHSHACARGRTVIHRVKLTRANSVLKSVCRSEVSRRPSDTHLAVLVSHVGSPRELDRKLALGESVPIRAPLRLRPAGQFLRIGGPS